MSAEPAVAATTVRGGSKSPKQSNASPKAASQANQSESKVSDGAALKTEPSSTVETTKPLAPPPRPGPAQGNNTPDYFTAGIGGSLSLEPNPFEQSFGGAPETPGGTKLPSVAALTSPSSLLPGTGATPFNWGAGSLRTGPLSPAMLSGPTTDYFSEPHHLRGFPPTPNESSLRTGLTPGGSGSMFPAPSPNSQALFAQIASGGATPSTIDFHRTALSAAAAKREQSQAQVQPPQAPITSQPQELANGNGVKPELSKPTTGPFDPHDNDAANGLFMLARQGRNSSQPQSEYPAPPMPQQPVHAHPAPPVTAQPQQPPPSLQQRPMNTSAQIPNGTSAPSHGARSDRGSVGSEEHDQSRPNTRGKKRGRKVEEPVAKTPSTKKAKTNGTANHVPPHVSPDPDMSDDDEEDDDDMKLGKDGSPRPKLSEEEKRKNFLERNRVAALKCRQRKKQWLANLQTKVEIFSQENESLTQQVNAMREEVVNLKTLLLAHKDCPVTQQQGLGGIVHAGFIPQQPMEPYGTTPISFGLAAPMAGPGQQPMVAQPVASVNGGDRRFS